MGIEEGERVSTVAGEGQNRYTVKEVESNADGKWWLQLELGLEWELKASDSQCRRVCLLIEGQNSRVVE